MEPDFWHERWSLGQIGFHQDRVHPALPAHAEVWLGTERRRVLVPLCGKSWDLDWIAKQGHAVTGVELSETAVKAFHAEHKRDHEVFDDGPYRVYRSENLDVLVGDVFDLGDRTFDRVWDRASMVALPADLRARYVETVKRVGAGGKLLLSTFVYDPSVMSGPPFSVPHDQVEDAYPGAVVLETDTTVAPAFQARGHSYFEQRLWLASL
jgi:thiopurine S-methyltransferase